MTHLAMTNDEAAQAIVALNQAYVAAAADFCRRRPTMAGIHLNMSPDHVAQFAEIRPTDLIRLNALPIAIVSPLTNAGRLLSARSVEEILASTQAAISTYRPGGQ
ncbi:MAG: hypothetical protein R3F54_23390 [Alphaproteobacteria bacterium]